MFSKLLIFIKIWRYWHSPSLIAWSYLAFVMVFGAIYYLSENTSITSISLIQSFYFSVITQTTLGYGDIQPATEWARFLTAIQALVGIALIGIFLNALSHHHLDFIDKRRSQRVKDNFMRYYKNFYYRMSDVLINSCPINLRPDMNKIVSGSDFFFYFNCHEDKGEYPIQYVLRSFRENDRITEECYVELEIFVQQIEYLLNNVTVVNGNSLTHLFKYVNRVRRINRKMHDFSENVANSIFGILTWVDHKNELQKEYDPLIDAVESI